MIRIFDQSYPVTSARLAQSQKALAQVLSRKDLGFFDLPSRQNLWMDASQEALRLRDKADHMVIMGIGGSSLGPKALYDIFEDPKNPKRLHFCDNVDPIEFDRLWSRLPSLERTVWVLISKSGSTVETLVGADLVFQKYKALGKKPQVVVVSEKKSNPMTEWATANQVPCLEIPLDVGGRYSVLSAVGMLPMAFLGLDIFQFQIGARSAINDSQTIANVISQMTLSFERNEWISFFWFYSSLYQNMGRWLQQLWAESLGKAMDRQGKPAPRASTPVTAIGSSDQHSVLQQVMEGAKDKFVVFTRIQSLENAGEVVSETSFPFQKFFLGHTMGQLIAAQAQGTKASLNAQGVSTMTLMVQDLTPKSLGYQLMFWQLVVAGLGEFMNIDAFNQPGVELGKRLAREILKS